MNQQRYPFTDTQGDKWDVTLTLAGARRIDESDFTAFGIDKGFSILEPKRDIFNRILTDSRLAMACVWAIVQPQVKEKLGIDPATDYDSAELAFMDRLDGSAIKEAKDALWGTLSDFFPDQRKALSTLKHAFDTAQKKIARSVEMMEGDITGIMEEEIGKEVETLKHRLQELRTSENTGPISSK